MHIDHTNFSRRSFLGASAVALAGLALSRSSFAEDAASGGDFGGLPIGVQSYTLRDRS
ncbi:MAG: hypothetical protein JWP03_1498, partial [Phycisphaerales bacterium]|nr:hypothetical protein [Phycisphaerales bacterium]